MSYNINHKIALAEPSPTGNIVPDAKRDKKITYLRRRIQPNSLRWNPINSCILQKPQDQVASTEESFLWPTLQSLSSYRSNSNYYLCNNCRYLPFKQDQNFTRQQFLSADNRLKEFSLCQQPKTLSEANRSQDDSRGQQSSRPTEVEDVLSQSSDKPLIRSGFFGSYHLWKIHRRSQSRIQSIQKRQTFLSSSALFRVSYQRLLAWGIKTWRCIYRFGLSRVLERMPCQTSTLYLPHTCKGRFRLFRPQIYRTSRRERNRLCRCSQNHPKNQKRVRSSTLSQIQEGLGSIPILLQTLQVEKSSSLHSDTQTITKEGLGATNTSHDNPLCLPGVCDQPLYETSEHLVLLQRPGQHRANYQRTEGRLHFGQYSHKQFSSQSSLFLSTSFCLQHSQLVQEILLATEISECYITNRSYRVFSSACKINQIGKQECAQDTSTIYLQPGTGADYAQN